VTLRRIRRRLKIAPSWRIISPPQNRILLGIVGEERRAVEATLARFSPYAHLVENLGPSVKAMIATPGIDVLLAPFAFPGPSRFSRGDFGVYYASADLKTAIAETRYHRALALAESHSPDARLPVTAFTAVIDAMLEDIRGMQTTLPGCYHPTDYRESQAYGALVKRRASPGIAYDSVRRAGGQCFGIFDPRALSDCARVHDLEYEWDGATQTMTKTRMEISID